MGTIEIHPANENEKMMAANPLAESEPWIALRIILEQCIKNCTNPDFQVYMAFSDSKPEGQDTFFFVSHHST